MLDTKRKLLFHAPCPDPTTCPPPSGVARKKIRGGGKVKFFLWVCRTVDEVPKAPRSEAPKVPRGEEFGEGVSPSPTD